MGSDRINSEADFVGLEDESDKTKLNRIFLDLFPATREIPNTITAKSLETLFTKKEFQIIAKDGKEKNCVEFIAQTADEDKCIQAEDRLLKRYAKSANALH